MNNSLMKLKNSNGKKMESCWQILKITATNDVAVIKKAYAKLLKQNSPEDNPIFFQQLREAYEQALLLADHEDFDESVTTHSTPAPLLDNLSSHNQTETNSTNVAPNLANEMIANIEQILVSEGQQAAIKKFQSICKSNTMESLDNAYELEGRLLAWIYNRLEIPEELVLTAAKHFNWLKQDNPFRYDENYSYVYPQINLLVKALLLKEKIYSQFPDLNQQQKKQMNKLLFEHCDDNHYANLVSSLLSSKDKELWQQIISFVYHSEYQNHDSPVSNQLFTWYSKNINIKNWLDNPWHNELNQPGQSPWSQLRYAWIFFWLIIWIIAYTSK